MTKQLLKNFRLKQYCVCAIVFCVFPLPLCILYPPSYDIMQVFGGSPHLEVLKELFTQVSKFTNQS